MSTKKPAAAVKKLSKDERRVAALKIAVALARKCGASRVSLAAVAAKQGVTAPLLFHIFERRELFLKDLLKAAKKEGVMLPDGAPTVRQTRTVRKPTPVPVPAKKVAALLKPKVVAPVVSTKKPLTPAQKTAKAARDKARRAPAAPASPASKFASLPAPFEASVAQL